MACKDCPPPHPEWLVCVNPECNAQYQDYAGLFHSRLCPKCAEKRRVQQQARVAAGQRLAGMRTNAPESA